MTKFKWILGQKKYRLSAGEVAFTNADNPKLFITGSGKGCYLWIGNDGKSNKACYATISGETTLETIAHEILKSLGRRSKLFPERHGLKKTKAYTSWCEIKRRCYHKNSTNYKNYGAKGVEMDERFFTFVNFYNYIRNMRGYRQYIKNNKLSLDRINSKKGYVPGNLRFATRNLQNSNRGLKSNTGITGISFNKRDSVFEVVFDINKKRVRIGSFKSLRMAVIAKNKFVKKNKVKLYGRK